MLFEREFAYFRAHQDDLARQYRGRHLVIVGERLIGDYGSAAEAYREALKQFAPGMFMIQQALPGEGAYTRAFRSRVRIA